MTSRSRPAVLAVLLVLLLGAVATFQGYGPLATDDAPEPAAAAPDTAAPAAPGATTPGTQVQIWDCTGAANQVWNLPS